MGSDNQYWLKKRSSLKRKNSLNKLYQNSILIVCEGEKTEPNYFKSFPVSNIKVKTIGAGRNTTSLVDYAVCTWKDFASEGKFFEKLWCVFDRDSFPIEDYKKTFIDVSIYQNRLNKRFKKITDQQIKIKIAYSNEAFEIWYLLHFDYIDSGLSRTRYKSMLSKRMGEQYLKNDPKIYQKLQRLAVDTNKSKGQLFAIRNSIKLRADISENEPHLHNPSTNVDELVVELNQYLKK